jgi:serine/threonine protein kinase/WD40 repeat protein
MSTAQSPASRQDDEYTRFKVPDWVEDPSLLGGEIPGEIGCFRIRKLIGEGGMGAVYLASQEEPVQREVAIKIIKRTIQGDEATKRMKSEWGSLARFNHPNIAAFIDCGYCGYSERIPFIVMEYIDGQDIIGYCQHPPKAGKTTQPGSRREQARKGELGLRERLEIFLQACEGLCHAHKKGVIHRDISARNVMVTERDEKAVVKIIDFGIAVLQDAPIKVAAGSGASGVERSAPVGTLAYMSPEQLSQPSAALDPQSDVYSMGVLLFELITGMRPYAASTKQEALSAQNKIRDSGKPPAPSTAIQELARTLDTGEPESRRKLRWMRRLQRHLRGDLDAIVLKATALDPEQRYDSMLAFAADLRAFLGGYLPETARPGGGVRKVSKFLRRNWPACTAAALAAIFLATAAGVNYDARLKQAERNAALEKEMNAAEAEKNRLASTNLRLRSAQAEAYAAQIRGVPDFLRNGEIGSVRRTLFGAAVSHEAAGALDNWEWNHLLGRIEAAEAVLGFSRAGFVDVLDAGEAVCGIAADGSVWFWDSKTGAFRNTRRPHKAKILAAAAGPDVCRTFDASGTLICWDAHDGSCAARIPTGLRDLDEVTAAFSPDGTLLCVHRPGKDSLEVVSLGPESIGKRLRELRLPDRSDRALLSWNNASLACIGSGRGRSDLARGPFWVRQWRIDRSDAADLEATELPGMSAGTLPLPLPRAFTRAAGRFLVQYSIGSLLFRLGGPGPHPGPVEDKTQAASRATFRLINLQVLPGDGHCAALSADGRWAATSGSAEGRIIRLWNAETGQFLGRLAGGPDDLGALLGHDDVIMKLAFAANSQALLSASMDGTIRRWKPTPPRYARHLEPEVTAERGSVDSVRSWLRFVRGDQLELLGVFSAYPWVACWKAETGKLSYEVSPTHERPPFLPAGREIDLAGASADGAVVALVCFDKSRNTSELIVGDREHLKTRPCKPAKSFSGPVNGLAISADGKQLALSMGVTAGVTLLWRLGAGALDGDPVVLAGGVGSLAFNDAGKKLAGGGDGFLRIWDLEKRGYPAETIPYPRGTLESLAFGFDGTRELLAAVGKQPIRDGGDADLSESFGLAVFDLGTKDVALVPVDSGSGQSSLIQGIAWAPSGNRIATAENDRTVRIWSVDHDACRLIFTLRDASGFLDAVAWSDDGRWIAAGSPWEGAYLYCGASQEDLAAQFLLRELQRDNPLSNEVKKRWSQFPKRHFFGEQLNRFIQFNGDDPRVVEDWAWKLLMPTDDRDAMEGLRTGRLDDSWKKAWEDARKLVERAARQWAEDEDLQLVLGLAHYRCGSWDDATMALTRFADARGLAADPPVDRGDRKRSGRDVIGAMVMAMARKKNGQEKLAREYWKRARALKQGRTLELDSAQDQAALNLAEDEASTLFEGPR